MPRRYERYAPKIAVNPGRRQGGNEVGSNDRHPMATLGPASRDGPRPKIERSIETRCSRSHNNKTLPVLPGDARQQAIDQRTERRMHAMIAHSYRGRSLRATHVARDIKLCGRDTQRWNVEKRANMTGMRWLETIRPACRVDSSKMMAQAPCSGQSTEAVRRNRSMKRRDDGCPDSTQVEIRHTEGGRQTNPLATSTVPSELGTQRCPRTEEKKRAS